MFPKLQLVPIIKKIFVVSFQELFVSVSKLDELNVASGDQNSTEDEDENQLHNLKVR